MVNAVDTEYTKGDVVRVISHFNINDYDYKTLLPDEPYTVTRVYKNKIEIKGKFERKMWSTSTPETVNDTISVFKTDIAPFDGPLPRKLGEVPEGDYISPQDPRIAWFFEDAGRLADQRNLCRTYDALADELGFPGRERTFKISTKINGLSAEIKVKARSKKQAEQQVAEQLKIVVTKAEED